MTTNPKQTLTQQHWIGDNYTDDPLAHIVQANGQLTDFKVALQNRVDTARDALCTWEQIGEKLGMTKQAAQQRFGR